MDAQLVPSLGPGPEGPRKIVAAHLNVWSGLCYDWRSQVVIRSGADNLAAVLETVLHPGDQVMSIVPTDAALRRPWHRRTRAAVVPWQAVAAPVWARIGIACLRADAWLILDVRGMSIEQLAGSHPAALPGMARRTITIGSMGVGQLGWIVGPKRIMSALAQTRDRRASLPAA